MTRNSELQSVTQSSTTLWAGKLGDFDQTFVNLCNLLTLTKNMLPEMLQLRHNSVRRVKMQFTFSSGAVCIAV